MSTPDPVRRLIEESLAAGDPTGWFERLYAAGAGGELAMPWDLGRPFGMLVDWAESQGLDGRGRRALVVGCGLGADAEYVAGLGFETVAFDIAGTAIRVARLRFPASPVHYLVADLLDPPASWRAAFDLVVESHTVQALPEPLRAKAIANVGPMVRPGGTLIVLAGTRDTADPEPAGPPWPLTRAEIDAFATGGLSAVKVEALPDPEDPPVRRWRAELRRPATPATGGSAGGGRAAGRPSTGRRSRTWPGTP